ncbi:MAG: hypothetical protein KAX64_04800, partial [Chromatiaceae bacterium]|nr:hypothetical protein [Chromatiaceae bacterium]
YQRKMCIDHNLAHPVIPAECRNRTPWTGILGFVRMFFVLALSPGILSNEFTNSCREELFVASANNVPNANKIRTESGIAHLHFRCLRIASYSL